MSYVEWIKLVDILKILLSPPPHTHIYVYFVFYDCLFETLCFWAIKISNAEQTYCVETGIHPVIFHFYCF